MKWFRDKFFFFSDEDKNQLGDLLNPKISSNSINVWYIFAVLGNIVPIGVAFFTNMLINDPNDVLSFLNNGAIPLVAYNILISAIFYLLDTTDPPLEVIRKKVLGGTILLLFVNIALFILITANYSDISSFGAKVTLVLTLTFLYFAIRTGRLMVVLQKEVIINFDDSMRESMGKVRKSPKSNKDDDVEY